MEAEAVISGIFLLFACIPFGLLFYIVGQMI